MSLVVSPRAETMNQLIDQKTFFGLQFLQYPFTFVVISAFLLLKRLFEFSAVQIIL